MTPQRESSPTDMALSTDRSGPFVQAQRDEEEDGFEEASFFDDEAEDEDLDDEAEEDPADDEPDFFADDEEEDEDLFKDDEEE